MLGGSESRETSSQTEQAPLNVWERVLFTLAAEDMTSYQLERGHIPATPLSAAQLLQLLTDKKLAILLREVGLDKAAISEQIGSRPRDDREQVYYCRGQVAAALGLNGGHELTLDQEIRFARRTSSIYELVAAGVVEPDKSGTGVVVHVRRGVDFCMKS